VTDAQIRAYFASEKADLSRHASRRGNSRNIDPISLAQALARDAQVIEDYPYDSEGPSALALAHLADGRPVHAVIGFSTEPWTIITVYRPDDEPHRWNPDFTKRRGRR